MNILRFDSTQSFIQALAETLCYRLWRNPALRLCLPSGNTPLPLYAALVDAVRRRELSFRHARIFALDEYGGLAPDDPGRCVSMLRRHLIDHIDLPPERFHFLDTLQPDIDRACAEFEAVLNSPDADADAEQGTEKREGGEKGGGGLGLTLLGIGRNGHLGLNEPGSAADSPTRRVALHAQSTDAARSYVRGSQLPTWGATLGMRQILGSAEIWLLGSGPAKAAIIERLVKGVSGPAPQQDPDADPDRSRTQTRARGQALGMTAIPAPDASLPASFLWTHPRCSLWVDPAAGARL